LRPVRDSGARARVLACCGVHRQTVPEYLRHGRGWRELGGGGGREGEEQGVCHFNSREWQLPCAKNVSPLPTQPPPPLHPDTRYHTSLRAHHCTQRSRAVVVLYRSEGVGTYLPVGLAPAAVMCGQPNSSLGVWQLVVTAQRWSLLYIRGPQLDAVNC
jgi:hypothetical protein